MGQDGRGAPTHGGGGRGDDVLVALAAPVAVAA
jgi:hypothetical protein